MIVPILSIVLLQVLKVILGDDIYNELDAYAVAITFYVGNVFITNQVYLTSLSVVETKINSAIISVLVNLITTILLSIVLVRDEVITFFVSYTAVLILIFCIVYL